MTAEEYVVKKLQTLEEEQEIQEGHISSLRSTVRELIDNLNFVISLIEPDTDCGGRKKYRLNVYEAYDEKNYKRLTEIMEGEKF